MERGVFAFACQYIVSPRALRAVRPATVLSHTCDILSLLKDDQIVRDNRLPVHCRHLVSRQHRTVIPVATQNLKCRYPCLLTPCLNVPNHFDLAQILLGRRVREEMSRLREGPQLLLTGLSNGQGDPQALAGL